MTNDDMRDRPGTLHDDALSKRTHIGGVPFSDMAAFNEDTRIAAIGRAAMTQSVTFMVESDACGEECIGKADRYIAKLHKQFPGQLIITNMGQPLTHMVTHVKVVSATAKVSKAEFLNGN